MRGNSGDSDKKVNLLITLLVNIQSTPIKNRGTPTNAQVHPIRFAGVYRNNNTYVLEVFAGKFAVPRNPKFTRHQAQSSSFGNPEINGEGSEKEDYLQPL